MKVRGESAVNMDVVNVSTTFVSPSGDVLIIWVKGGEGGLELKVFGGVGEDVILGGLSAVKPML